METFMCSVTTNMADDEDVPPVLLPCAICARTFKPLSLEKHAKICEKTAIKKRKPFDSAKQRIQGTELAEFLPVQSKRRVVHEDRSSKPKTSWKQTHNEFIRAIRAARGDIEDSPTPTRNAAPNVPTAAPTRANEKGTCSTCHRQFGIKAYDRHVTWCKERSIRLPVNAATNVAKERLEARIKYKAPALKNRRLTNREKYSSGSAGNLLVSEKTSPIGTGPKPRETMSVPSCAKSNDNSSRGKPIVSRRLGQHRESSTTSGPMKSRLVDRTNRPSEESESTSTPTPPSPLSSRYSISPSVVRKMPRNTTTVTSSPMKCIRKPEILASLALRRFDVESSPGKKSSGTKLNLLSASTRGSTESTEITANHAFLGMTIKPCVIYRNRYMTTLKQISPAKSRDETSLRGDKNRDDPMTADLESDDRDAIVTRIPREKTNHRYDVFERALESYRRRSSLVLKRDEETLHHPSSEISSKNSLWVENVEKLDKTYPIKESRDPDCSHLGWQHASMPVNDNPTIEVLAKKSDELNVLDPGGCHSHGNLNDFERQFNFKETNVTESPKVMYPYDEVDLIDFGEQHLEFSRKPLEIIPRNELDVSSTVTLPASEIPQTSTPCGSPEKDTRSSKMSRREHLIERCHESWTNQKTAPLSGTLNPDELDVEHNASEISRSSPRKTDPCGFEITLMPLDSREPDDMTLQSIDLTNPSTPLSTNPEVGRSNDSNNDNILISNQDDSYEPKVGARNIQHGHHPLDPVVTSNTRRNNHPISRGNFKRKNRAIRTIGTIWRRRKPIRSCKRSKNNGSRGSNIKNCAVVTAVSESKEISRTKIVEGTRRPEREMLGDNIGSTECSERITGSLNDSLKLYDTTHQRRCGTYVIERRSIVSAKHYGSDESVSGRPTQKRRKTEAIEDRSELRVRGDIVLGRGIENETQKSEASRITLLEKTDLEDENLKRKVIDYVNETFDYKSDNTVINNNSNDEVARTISPRRLVTATKPSSSNDLGERISDSTLQTRVSLVKISSASDSVAIHKCIRRNMNILKDSTDDLVSSVDAAAGSERLAGSRGPYEKEICTIRSIGGNNAIRSEKSLQFLPKIRQQTSETVVPFEFRARRTISFWETGSREVQPTLMSLEASPERYRSTRKKNPESLFLPPLRPSSTPSVEFASGSSQDYDPFLAAERQMNELFEGTGDQYPTEGSPTNNAYSPSTETKVTQFPLSHSSAFVKYPSSPPANKRASVIAPPSEFDDFASDFSSDSTETNSVTREFFINNLNAQTRQIDDSDKLTRDCNRRVVIDKSKVASDNDSNSNSNRGKTFVSSVEKSRKILEKISPKVVRPTVNRSHSVRSSRAASAPRAPERKSSLKKTTSQKNEYANTYNKTSNHNSYTNLSGSNLSLSSMPSSEVDIKRSNSVFDEFLSSFEDEVSSFPSLKSFLKSDSVSTSMSSPLQSNRPRNGMISDEELSSPDSYKRQDHGKLSADSAYSSLNRKCSNYGRSTTDVGSRLDEEISPKRRDAEIMPSTIKLSKFCHECGSRFPEAAKFCCECGIKRLCL